MYVQCQSRISITDCNVFYGQTAASAERCLPSGYASHSVAFGLLDKVVELRISLLQLDVACIQSAL
jgi:hypothetical protein